MKKSLFTSLALIAVLTSGAAMAQTVTTPTAPAGPVTPRVDQVDQRLETQQQNINSSASNGTLTPKQAAHDTAVDNKVAGQLKADEAKHNGHITKAEQRKMNKELNHNKKRIHHQKVKDGTAPVTAAPVTPAQ